MPACDGGRRCGTRCGERPHAAVDQLDVRFGQCDLWKHIVHSVDQVTDLERCCASCIRIPFERHIGRPDEHSFAKRQDEHRPPVGSFGVHAVALEQVDELAAKRDEVTPLGATEQLLQRHAKLREC